VTLKTSAICVICEICVTLKTSAIRVIREICVTFKSSAIRVIKQVQPEEAMLRPDILRKLREPVLEHHRHPRVTDMTVTHDALLVDEPVDGLATAAPAQLVALRRPVHLLLGE
jgi:hypothetical protein